MNTIEEFGFTWKNENLNGILLHVHVLTNDQIGNVLFTMNCLQTIHYDNVWKEEDYYKLLSLIHEKRYWGNRILFIKKKIGTDLRNQV